MKAKNFRVGNLVMTNDLASNCKPKKILEISGIGLDLDFTDGTTQNYVAIDGMPISKYWLEKLGFNENDCKQFDFYWQHPLDEPNEDDELIHCLNIYWQDESFVFIELTNDHGEYATYPIRNLKYVHELQNLFFALTGKEIEVKQEVSA